MTAVADWISALPALRLSPGEFAAPPSYAIHDAIAVYPGTRWKTLEARRGFFPTSAPRWVVGEGVQDGGSHVRITWYRPIITLRAAVAPAEQAPSPVASPAAAPSPPPGQAEGTPPRAPRRRRAYASPVWTPARDEALRRLILTDMPHAAMLAELNAIPAATTKARFAVVHVAGVPHAIVDIGMRMLLPEELAAAQALSADYRWARPDGTPMGKTAIVRLIGNSVSPPPAAALLRSLLGVSHERKAA